MRVDERRVSNATGGQQLCGVKSFPDNSAASKPFWRIALLAAAGLIGSASCADAAIFWSEAEPGYSQPAPPVVQRPRKPRRNPGKAIEAALKDKDTAKPQGPLIIAISIEQQSLKVYDANGFFAETPISTGTRDHPTPLGVFSIIQKHKLHHSNIYSDAPMPYMQRITWSGVAMHAGVLPGYPASHGCIRMPLTFAVRMWGWTRMGARVFVTPGEITPSSFSHPVLLAQKAAPQPVAAAEPRTDAPAAAKSDKAAVADTAATPLGSRPVLELRSAVGRDRAKPDANAAAASTPLREKTHTADASSALSPTASLIVSDAISSANDTGTKSGSAAEAPAIESVKAEKAIVETAGMDVARTGGPASEAAGSDTPNPTDNADAKVRPMANASPDTPDLKKDQARAMDAEKAAPAKPELAVLPAPKRRGQIAVFVSRKDGKLYVRQNFTPLFDVRVTIAPSDRPLGTHVFTAQTDRDDANVVRWSVVSLPVRSAERRDEDESASRRRRTTGAVEVTPAPVQNSAAEALDRVSIPADAMARIAESLSTGSSIIVSDQGISGGETGEGTDFIVSLR